MISAEISLGNVVGEDVVAVYSAKCLGGISGEDLAQFTTPCHETQVVAL